MVLEATRILEEGIVRDVRDVDLGLILGLGFPAFKGGLLFWADRVGTPALLEQLKDLEALGERIRPTPRWLDMGRGKARRPDHTASSRNHQWRACDGELRARPVRDART